MLNQSNNFKDAVESVVEYIINKNHDFYEDGICVDILNEDQKIEIASAFFQDCKDPWEYLSDNLDPVYDLLKKINNTINYNDRYDLFKDTSDKLINGFIQRNSDMINESLSMAQFKLVNKEVNDRNDFYDFC